MLFLEIISFADGFFFFLVTFNTNMTTKQSEQLFVYFSGLKYISARQILHFSLQNAPQFMSDKVITICIRA